MSDIFKEEIEKLQARVEELETKIDKLEYTEEWKALIDGISYRRVGTKVEININKTFTEVQSIEKWGELIFRATSRTVTGIQ